MADFSAMTTYQTFLKANLIVKPDGVSRPKVILDGEDNADDVSGSLASGVIKLLSIAFHPAEKVAAGLLKLTYMITCSYTMEIDTTSTYGDFIDVLEDIEQQHRENNISNTYTYYTLEFNMRSNIRSPSVDFIVKVEVHNVSASS